MLLLLISYFTLPKQQHFIKSSTARAAAAAAAAPEHIPVHPSLYRARRVRTGRLENMQDSAHNIKPLSTVP